MTGLAAQSAEVTRWPERLVLTLMVVGVCLMAAWLMRRSWRNRARREADIAMSPIPVDRGTVLHAADGRYLGTSPAGQWMHRVTGAGLGAPGNAVASVTTAGVFLDRVGEPTLFWPAGRLSGVDLGRGIAAEVAEEDGLVVWGWPAGKRDLRSGFRPQHAEDVVALLTATHRILNPSGKEIA